GVDYTVDGSNFVTATFHIADQHVRFANLDYFNPQRVSPNTADSTYSGDLTEHTAFKGTLLDSSISAATYRDSVWPQSPLGMTLTPTINEGNYFSQQTRTSSRLEWRESWSFSKQSWGTHTLKS